MNTDFNQPSDQYYDEFEQNGYVVSERAITTDMCAELLRQILHCAQEHQSDYILQSDYRIHAPLPLSWQSRQAMIAIIEPYAEMLHRFFSDPASTQESDLVELSSITVFPHAEAQTIHPDEQNEHARVVSIFVNLAPTKAESGALQIIPGSHKDLDTKRSAEEASAVVLPEGSAVFMNSKTWHGGGGNETLDSIRPVFYFSFGAPNLQGPTYSIRDNVKGLGLTLADFISRDGLRHTGWRAESQPMVSRNLQVYESLQQRSTFIAMNNDQIVDQISLAHLPLPIVDFFREIMSEQPSRTLEEYAPELDIQLPDLIDFVAQLGKRGWLCWNSAAKPA
jgi:hypothetical protein